jgi:hypothetical protein
MTGGCTDMGSSIEDCPDRSRGHLEDKIWRPWPWPRTCLAYIGLGLECGTCPRTHPWVDVNYFIINADCEYQFVIIAELIADITQKLPELYNNVYICL